MSDRFLSLHARSSGRGKDVLFVTMRESVSIEELNKFVGLQRPKSGHKEVVKRIATALQEREDDDKGVEFMADGMQFKALFTEMTDKLKV